MIRSEGIDMGPSVDYGVIGGMASISGRMTLRTGGSGCGGGKERVGIVEY